MDLFGRSGLFNEYTVHNFTHVEAMLDDLDWLIPETSKQKLTPADWLLITLSIYFHDLGLIVTEEEYRNRDKSAFALFCEKVLFAKDDGEDYRIKVEALGEERAAKFLYQEFVRHNHGERVRSWIEGSTQSRLGDARVQVCEINSLLSRLNPEFRRDLALVCESHNLDDLEDLKKYKPFKPYGRAQTEAANLLYVAVILRTVDLLQITRQRAPSIMFRMINPTDPISQTEWAKQNAVTGVFPKPGKDKDGIVDETVQSTIISVHAKFNNANGFFGLTSYLSYAQKQISYSRDCVDKANIGIRNKLSFPWVDIDDSEVEAVGFIPHPFEFKLDQTRILDLLTGHTLYNESTVAIRELVQNSLDAVRVYKYDRNRVDLDHIGAITVEWDSENLQLSVVDNGTGMTQEIIERHLLNVGSSRYQDPAFKDAYKNFSPISRFDIGVLSTFMVADDVQIVTFHEDESEGREISLRSVHGKYLIRLLNKEDSDEARQIGPHGTKITLRFRSSAKRVDIVRTLQRWIVFPGCDVKAVVDRQHPVQIGFSTPKDALRDYITNNPEFGFSDSKLDFIEQEKDGITIAYAMVYNRHYRDSSFVEYSDTMRRAREIQPTGICIEGVRVEFDPPGFGRSKGLLAIANCRGKSAPKTNVSRTLLESEADKNRVTRIAMDLYMNQVQIEIDRMQSKEEHSLSYAIDQFPFISGQLFASNDITEDEIRFNAAWNFPMFILENHRRREAVTGRYLHEIGGFWSIESQAISSLIALLRDSPPTVTCREISIASQFKGDPLPDGNLIVNTSLSFVATQLTRTMFEISELKASVADRRLDMRWEPMHSTPKWLSLEEVEAATVDVERSRSIQARRYGAERNQRRRASNVNIPLGSIEVGGLQKYFCVETRGGSFLLPGTPLCSFLKQLDLRSAESRLQLLIYVDSLFASRGSQTLMSDIDSFMKEIIVKYNTDSWEISRFLASVKETEDRLQIFNPWSWQRQEKSNGGVEWDDIPF